MESWERGPRKPVFPSFKTQPLYSSEAQEGPHTGKRPEKLRAESEPWVTLIPACGPSSPHTSVTSYHQGENAGTGWAHTSTWPTASELGRVIEVLEEYRQRGFVFVKFRTCQTKQGRLPKIQNLNLIIENIRKIQIKKTSYKGTGLKSLCQGYKNWAKTLRLMEPKKGRYLNAMSNPRLDLLAIKGIIGTRGRSWMESGH